MYDEGTKAKGYNKVTKREMLIVCKEKILHNKSCWIVNLIA